MTGAISDAASVAFRDFVVDGVPSTGANDPGKAAIRSVFDAAQTAIDTIGQALLASGAAAYASRAALYADLAHPPGAIGWVNGDATAANNGLYVKVGASGSGSWAYTGVTIASIVTLAMLGSDVIGRLIDGDVGPYLKAVYSTAGVALVVKDVAGKLALMIDGSGRTLPSKLNIPADTTVAGSIYSLLSMLVPGDVGPFIKSLPVTSNMAWAVRDLNGLVALALDITGRLNPSKLNVPADTTVAGKSGVLASMLLPTDVAPYLQSTPVTSGYAFVVRDQSGQVKFAVPVSGPAVLKVTSAALADGVAPGGVSYAALSADALSKLSTHNYWAETQGSTPSRKLFINNRSTGQRNQITASDPSAPMVVDDKYVEYLSSTNGLVYQPVGGGPEYPVYPANKLTFWGDSLTQNPGVSASGDLITNLGAANVQNKGVSGQGVTDIAIRQGGIQPAITVSGNTIPATGSVAVTAIAPATGYRGLGSAFSFTGKLNGVQGTLAYDTSFNWTFTASGLSSPAPCPAGSTFVSDQWTGLDSNCQNLWMGRNNVNQATFIPDTLNALAACVAFLKPLIKRFVVISITNGVTELSGSTNYNLIVAANAQIQAAYGGAYYDLRRDFILNGCAAVGVTPTSADLANIAADAPPPSLMTAGDIHPNSLGYQAQAILYANYMNAKGFFK